MQTQHHLNKQQYHEKSEAYLQSTVHAEGIEFKKMRDLVQQYPHAQLLDLGCGGGHVSYQLAPHVASVIAYDLSTEMTELVAMQAKLKGLDNIQVQVGAAEQLDFPEQCFDVVISRYSAYHWQNLDQALQQVYRVLKPKGTAIFFDVLGSSHPILDTFLQCVEMIRDPSHVRDYSLAEWFAHVECHGFKVEVVEKQSLRLDFQAWVSRMQTASVATETIRYLQEKVSDQVRDYYQISHDGSFTLPTLYLQLSKS